MNVSKVHFCKKHARVKTLCFFCSILYYVSTTGSSLRFVCFQGAILSTHRNNVFVYWGSAECEREKMCHAWSMGSRSEPPQRSKNCVLRLTEKEDLQYQNIEVNNGTLSREGMLALNIDLAGIIPVMRSWCEREGELFGLVYFNGRPKQCTSASERLSSMTHQRHAAMTPDDYHNLNNRCFNNHLLFQRSIYVFFVFILYVWDHSFWCGPTTVQRWY